MSKEIRLKVPKTFPHYLEPVTIVSDEDYDFLNQFNWYAKKSAGTEDKYHAARGVAIIPKKNDTIRMHRLITEARHDAIVYHINENTLDNRRGNLQSRTIHPWTGRASNAGFRGVSQMNTNKWRAEIKHAGRSYNLGEKFTSAVDAAYAYDEAAIKLFGIHAITNMKNPHMRHAF